MKLEDFLDPHVLLLALGLIAAAVVGKLASGLGVGRRNGIHRLAVGIGIILSYPNHRVDALSADAVVGQPIKS